MIRFLLLVLATLTLTTSASAKSFINAREVVSETGVKAWLVEDKTVPVIAISLMFKGGAALDPVDKAGLANLVSTLMDEGAGEDSSEAFQKKLKDHAIQFSFSAGRDGFYGQVKTTVTHKSIASGLLKQALLAPRFDVDAIDRMRRSLITSIKYDTQDAGWHAQKALLKTLYGDHPYARQIKGDIESLVNITRDDLVNYHTQTITRDNIIIGIAGDITAADTVLLLDDVFGELPETGTRNTVAMADLNLTDQITYAPWAGSQSVIMMAQKGITRRDSDWFTAQLTNYILGGGGFSSRLMDEIRVKRGLTYGISTGVIDYQYGPLMLGQASVDQDKVNETIRVIKEEWQKMIIRGVTVKELADAKAYLIGSLPLSLSSTNAIASVLVQMQEDDLPIDYLDFRADDINRVTRDSLNRFAKAWLDADALTFAVAKTPETKIETSPTIENQE